MISECAAVSDSGIEFGGYAEQVIVNAASYDALEVHGVRLDADQVTCEVDDSTPTFFSTYAHRVDGGVVCVGDFETLKKASEYAGQLSAQYGWPLV